MRFSWHNASPVQVEFWPEGAQFKQSPGRKVDIRPPGKWKPKHLWHGAGLLNNLGDNVDPDR